MFKTKHVLRIIIILHLIPCKFLIAQTPDKKISLQVINVYNPNYSGLIQLNEKLIVEVQDLDQYLEQNNRKAENFILFLDWHKLDGIQGRLIDKKNQLEFDIQRTEASKSEWNKLLGKPLSGNRGFSALIDVSVEYENEPAIPGKSYKLQFIDKSGFFWFLVFLAFPY